jgi:alkanesulfonate monooxygenase SsuD/methylene tetrahydromethanopterin reductase-like flavin-dependent oxidoreductase (luciferase family)
MNYVATFRCTFGDAAPLPNMGIVRMIYVGKTEKEANETAARAYASFYQSASTLYRRFQTTPQFFPAEYEAVKAAGVMIAGTADQVAAGDHETTARDRCQLLCRPIRIRRSDNR